MKSKVKRVKGWVVINPFSYKGIKQVLYDSGYPMIFIQPTKPKVILYGDAQLVVPIIISYSIPKNAKKKIQKA